MMRLIWTTYNDTNNFLGPADKFESEEEAQKYIASYRKKMNDHLLDKYGRHKTSISLKVFVVDDEIRHIIDMVLLII